MITSAGAREAVTSWVTVKNDGVPSVVIADPDGNTILFDQHV